jgi:uncharacterized protein with TBP-like fold DUF4468
MKIFIIITVLFISSISYGQEIKIDEETGRYGAIGVVQVDGIMKKAMYKSAIEWISLNYKSANDVIQMKDEESSKIIVKGNFLTGLFMKQGWIKHTLLLEFRDNRFRYTYTDFSYYSSGSGEIAFEQKMMSKKKIISEAESNIKASIQSLKNYILRNSKADDNW